MMTLKHMPFLEWFILSAWCSSSADQVLKRLRSSRGETWSSRKTQNCIKQCKEVRFDKQTSLRAPLTWQAVVSIGSNSCCSLANKEAHKRSMGCVYVFPKHFGNWNVPKWVQNVSEPFRKFKKSSKRVSVPIDLPKESCPMTALA